MKHLSKLLTAICLSASGMTIQVQNAIPASGGNASGSGDSVSYSIGQVDYTTNTGTSG